MSIEIIESDEEVVETKPRFLPIEELDLANIEPCAARAADAKERGNKLFAKGQYEAALECYAEALLFVPEADVSDRATYHNNKAAAHYMRTEWQDCVDEASYSLELVDKNIKAHTRRARAYEHMDKMSEALADYKAIAELQPNVANKRKVSDMEKIVNERFEKQKDEMLGKLKDFGNTILGKFGMSLDQFQAVQDPATGSYSVSFGNKQPDADNKPEDQ